MYFLVRTHSHSRIENRRQLQIFSMPNISRASATCRGFPQIVSLIIHTARLSLAGTSSDLPRHLSAIHQNLSASEKSG